MNRIAFVVAGVFVVGVIGAGWWHMYGPGSMMDGGGHMMAAPSGEGSGEPMVKVRVPAELSAEARRGKPIFEANCASCHGPKAGGRDGLGPPLVHRIYEPGHHSDAAILRAALNGAPSHHWQFGDMPPVQGVTARDVRLITRYLRELQRANGIY